MNYELPTGETRELMPWEAEDAGFPVAPRIPRIPKGCDYQGRHPEAAEAATELGCDEYGPMYPLTPVEVRSLTVIGIIALAALVSFVAFIARYF